jgi:hypothetical protein
MSMLVAIIQSHQPGQCPWISMECLLRVCPVTKIQLYFDFDARPYYSHKPKSGTSSDNNKYHHEHHPSTATTTMSTTLQRRARARALPCILWKRATTSALAITTCFLAFNLASQPFFYSSLHPILCFSTSLTMSAVWTPREETALVDFLVENKAEAGDGGNFKNVTFQRAVLSLAPLHERGAPKTVKSCQNKYATVSFFNLILVIGLLNEGSSSARSTASFVLSNWFRDGFGMTRRVPVSLSTQLPPGRTMSRSTQRPSHFGTKAGRISARLWLSCPRLPPVPMCFIHLHPRPRPMTRVMNLSLLSLIQLLLQNHQ